MALCINCYFVFLSQIVSLTAGEQDWLSSHLGHEIHIDKDFYRANDAVLEISKISRLLMVAHTGQMSKYAGKTLAEIGIVGMVYRQFKYCFIIKEYLRVCDKLSKFLNTRVFLAVILTMTIVISHLKMPALLTLVTD